MKERQINLACVKNVVRRLFRRRICPNIRDEGTQTRLAPRPRATGVRSVIKYSSPAINSWYILGKNCLHTMVDFWDCYWGHCSDFVTNSCVESWDSSCKKSRVSVPKHNGSKIENAWAFVYPDSLSEDRLQNSVLRYTEIEM